jgi:hypothetical protein
MRPLQSSSLPLHCSFGCGTIWSRHGPPCPVLVAGFAAFFADAFAECAIGSGVAFDIFAGFAIAAFVDSAIAVVVFSIACLGAFGAGAAFAFAPDLFVAARHDAFFADADVGCLALERHVASPAFSGFTGAVIVDLAVAVIVDAIACLFAGEDLSFANGGPGAI